MTLKDTLKEALGWSQYEAAAYTALVRSGPMEASDVALEADIPDARVYGVLSGLEKKGCVLKQDKRPAIYDAQNPHYVIQREQDEFIEQSEEVEAMLENAWESERDIDDHNHHESWVLTSASGTVNEIRKRLEMADDSIRFIDADLRWITRRNDLDILNDRADDGVDIEIIGPSKNALEDLMDLDATLMHHDDITKSYYIIDGKHVIMRLDSDGTGIVFTDESMATIFLTDFEDTRTQATEVQDIAA